MNVAYYIARRYLFAKKSHNAINVISMISVCGIAVATLAIVCAMSIFNGFSQLTTDSFNHIDPDLRIEPAKGKVFDPNNEKIKQALSLGDVDFVVESIEENALAKYNDKQMPVLIKGVSPNFANMADTAQFVIDGVFLLQSGDLEFCIPGVGVTMKLGINTNIIRPVEIYAPKRDVKINTSNLSTAFKVVQAHPSGVFALNQAKFDEQVLLVSIDLARDLFRYETEVSALEIRLKENASADKTQSEIEQILGDNYLVKNKYQQHTEAYRMVNIEKWVTFLILIFVLILAVFNIVGSLSMLIVDKKEDIKILQNLGASNKLITRIFLLEGWFISMLGALSGLVLGLLLCLIQQYFGILKLGQTPGAYIIDAYPLKVIPSDIFFIFITVSIISFTVVLYPVGSLKKKLDSPSKPESHN